MSDITFGTRRVVVHSAHSGTQAGHHRGLQRDPFGFMTAWIAITIFGLQIEFDFFGYSEGVIGLGRMLSVVLPRNYQYPYISRNPQDRCTGWRFFGVAMLLILFDETNKKFIYFDF